MQRLVLATLLGIILASPLAIAHNDNPLFEWWFSSDPGTTCDHTMYQNDASHDGLDVTIANGDSRVWEADQAAAYDLDMGGPTQVYTLTLLVKQGASLVAEIGVCHIDGSFDSWESHAVSQGIAGPVLIPQPVQSVTERNENVVFTPQLGSSVPAGDRLAVRIMAAGNTVIIGTQDDPSPLAILAPKEGTHLHATLPPPAYPLPELPALMLSGAGLAAVALIARRRT